ncbi:hypothetical protein NL676_018602 [Syzygium grande]|nr:hypothetical protein NL676_018602 [Syzygium grande]
MTGPGGTAVQGSGRTGGGNKGGVTVAGEGGGAMVAGPRLLRGARSQPASTHRKILYDIDIITFSILVTTEPDIIGLDRTPKTRNAVSISSYGIHASMVRRGQRPFPGFGLRIETLRRELPRSETIAEEKAIQAARTTSGSVAPVIIEGQTGSRTIRTRHTSGEGKLPEVQEERERET